MADSSHFFLAKIGGGGKNPEGQDNWGPYPKKKIEGLPEF